MRKQIVIRNTAQAARKGKKVQLITSLQGKTVGELKMAELLSLVEYLAREQNLVDETGHLSFTHTGQAEDIA